VNRGTTKLFLQGLLGMPFWTAANVSRPLRFMYGKIENTLLIMPLDSRTAAVLLYH